MRRPGCGSEGCGGPHLGIQVDQTGKAASVCSRRAVSNLLDLGGHLVKAERYRNLGISAFNEWGKAVA